SRRRSVPSPATSSPAPDREDPAKRPRKASSGRRKVQRREPTAFKQPHLPPNDLMAPQPAHIQRDAKARDESYRDSISTVDKQGKRVWVYPKKPGGKLTRWRQRLAYALVALLLVGPFIRINGDPLLMINLLERRFVFFGQ